VFGITSSHDFLTSEPADVDVTDDGGVVVSGGSVDGD